MKRSGIVVLLHSLVRRYLLWRRERRIIESCGCVTFCPKCKDPLNDQATWLASNGEGLGTYKCNKCGQVSEWHFGIAPVPVLLHPTNTSVCGPSPQRAQGTQDSFVGTLNRPKER